jgi:hypothetical protein
MGHTSNRPLNLWYIDCGKPKEKTMDTITFYVYDSDALAVCGDDNTIDAYIDEIDSDATKDCLVKFMEDYGTAKEYQWSLLEPTYRATVVLWGRY